MTAHNDEADLAAANGGPRAYTLEEIQAGGIAPTAVDPQTRYENERRALLDAHRAVLKHLINLMQARDRNNAGSNVELAKHATYLRHQIESLEHAE